MNSKYKCPDDKCLDADRKRRHATQRWLTAVQRRLHKCFRHFFNENKLISNEKICSQMGDVSFDISCK